MKADQITRRQMSALLFLTLLSPLIRVLPRHIAGAAGGMSWVSPVLALPFALLGLWLLGRLLSRRREGEGLAELLLRGLGPRAGRAVLFLCGGWMLFYAGFLLTSGAERLVSTVYPSSYPWPFLIFMLALSLPAALGPLQSLARSAVVFRPVLLGLLALVFLLLAPEAEPGLLRPSLRGLPGAAAGVPAVLNVLGVGISLSFLAGHVPREAGFFRRYLGLVLTAVGLAVLFCAVTVGIFGPKLTEKLTFPFFVLLRDLSVLRVVERLEALVLAIWMISDFMPIAALQLAAFHCLHLALLGRPPAPRLPGRGVQLWRDGRFLVWLGAAAVLIVAFSIAPDSYTLQHWSDDLIPPLAAVYAFVLIPGSLAVGLLRKRL